MVSFHLQIRNMVTTTKPLPRPTITVAITNCHPLITKNPWPKTLTQNQPKWNVNCFSLGKANRIIQLQALQWTNKIGIKSNNFLGVLKKRNFNRDIQRLSLVAQNKNCHSRLNKTTILLTIGLFMRKQIMKTRYTSPTITMKVITTRMFIWKNKMKI